MNNKRLVAIILAVVLILGGGGAYLFRAQIRAGIDVISGNDYSGSGSGTVVLSIAEGQTGSDVASNLVKLGVTKNFSYTYKVIVGQNPVFIPGNYSLHKHMSVISALDLLKDPKSRIVKTVTVKEGLRLKNVFAVLSSATGISVADFLSASSDPAVFGLPASLPSLEGFLFPATYEYDSKTTAKSMIKMMVQRMQQELQKQGVSSGDQLKVLTLASIIQKEARQTADFYKVSRVFTNRLDLGMKLQSDATVSYGSGGTTVTTTDAERSASNGYNTYVHSGLPIGPISAPGSIAIDAALHPASGDWLYFVAVNLKTGETVFSTTYAEHQKAVAQWQAWMRANPGWNG